MILVVSDFDGTFFDNNYDKNVEFIDSIKNKVDFIIATGRNYDELNKDLKTECKYYICNDGGYILDHNKNVIYQNTIDHNTVLELYLRILKLGYKEYYFDNVVSCNNIPLDNINKIFIKIENNKNTENDINYLISGLYNVYAYESENWINIMGLTSTKDKAIDYILQHTNYEKLYVLGNDVNDYSMIKRYNGYLISSKKIEGFNCINNFMDLKNIVEDD